MTSVRHVLLDDRGLLEIRGEDARAFLQGLVSNDVMRVAADCAVYAAFLTPQGKYLHDFFLFEVDGALFVDCERDRATDLLKRLRLYKLRSQVEIADISAHWAMYAVFAHGGNGDAAAFFDLPERVPGSARIWQGGAVFADPRLAGLGLRCLQPVPHGDGNITALGSTPRDRSDYDRLRISLGVADGSRDMPVNKAILLEYGFDELHGVDWNKGCFMGQELTARTKYRALIRKRMIPVRVSGPMPEPGTAIERDGNELGELRSGVGDVALAHLRLEALSPRHGLRAGDAAIEPFIPDWMKLPDPVTAK